MHFQFRFPYPFFNSSSQRNSWKFKKVIIPYKETGTKTDTGKEQAHQIISSFHLLQHLLPWSAHQTQNSLKIYKQKFEGCTTERNRMRLQWWWWQPMERKNNMDYRKEKERDATDLLDSSDLPGPVLSFLHLFPWLLYLGSKSILSNITT